MEYWMFLGTGDRGAEIEIHVTISFRLHLQPCPLLHAYRYAWQTVRFVETEESQGSDGWLACEALVLAPRICAEMRALKESACARRSRIGRRRR